MKNTYLLDLSPQESLQLICNVIYISLTAALGSIICMGYVHFTNKKALQECRTEGVLRNGKLFVGKERSKAPLKEETVDNKQSSCDIKSVAPLRASL